MKGIKPGIEPKSRSSLGQMMELLRDLDDDMLPEEFDPQELIGDVREKVDGIKWKMDDWEYKCRMIEERFIAPLKRRVKALNGKRDKLKRYVTEEMKRLNIEKIPGNLCRVNLQSSVPSVEITVDATAQMYLNYPEIVLQKTTYVWDKEEIKSRIKNGERYTFAEVKQGKHIKFYTQGDTDERDTASDFRPIGKEQAQLAEGHPEGLGTISRTLDTSSLDRIWEESETERM